MIYIDIDKNIDIHTKKQFFIKICNFQGNTKRANTPQGRPSQDATVGEQWLQGLFHLITTPNKDMTLFAHFLKDTQI